MNILPYLNQRVDITLNNKEKVKNVIIQKTYNNNVFEINYMGSSILDFRHISPAGEFFNNHYNLEKLWIVDIQISQDEKTHIENKISNLKEQLKRAEKELSEFLNPPLERSNVDGIMTTKTITKENLERLWNAIEYSRATIEGNLDSKEKQDWVLIHRGRAESSKRFLQQAIDLVKEMKRELNNEQV